MKKLIILDRDGVINEHNPNYVRHLTEFHFINGSLEAIKKLLRFEVNICVVSNQAGVAKGVVKAEAVEEINNFMSVLFEDADRKRIKFFYCYHLASEYCTCRKPQPGNLLAALSCFEARANEAIFVGDNKTDFQAAVAARIDFCLVRTGLGSLFANELKSVVPVFDNLSNFVDEFIGGSSG